MTCKYCGAVTDSTDCICRKCKYAFAESTTPVFEDIFSSSEKETKTRVDDIFTTEENGLNDGTVAKNANVVKNGKKKRGIITALCLVVFAACAVCAIYCFLFNSSVSRVEDCLKKGQYKEARNICVTEFDVSGSKALNKMLNERLSDGYAAYCAGSVEFAAAKDEFTAIKDMNISEVSENAEKHLKKLETAKVSKTAFSEAEKQYSSNNYASAIQNYKKVIKDDCNYDTAVSKLEQAMLNYRNTALSEAATSVSEGDYATAVKTLKTALVVLEKDEIVEKRLTEYNKSLESKSRQEVIDTAEKYIYREEYALAAKTVKDAMENNEEFKNDEVLKAAYDRYAKNTEDALTEKIDKLIEAGDYTLAASTVKDAQEVLGEDNAVLAQNKAKLSGNVPVYLDDLTPYSSENFKWGGSAVDSFGVDRSKETNHATLTTTSVVTFPVPQGYKNFTCNLAASKSIDAAVKCRLRITATVGGEYMYKECEISASAETQELSINVSESTAVTFSVSGEGADIILYNAFFEK